jgi:hypothetical protein
MPRSDQIGVKQYKKMLSDFTVANGVSREVAR